MLTGTATGKTYRVRIVSSQAEMKRNWLCHTITDAQKTVHKIYVCMYRCICVPRTVYNPKFFFFLPRENFKFLTKIMV